MANPQNAQWPTRWPMMLPFPRSIPRSRAPVPNSQSVNWPQSQFAPLYLPPGSPSYQPYSYLKNNVPLASVKPHYSHHIPPTLGLNHPYRGGPSGDIARLPLGGIMRHNPSRRQMRKIMKMNKRARALAAQASRQRTANWGWRTRALAVEAATPVPAPSLYPAVVRLGARPTSQPIVSGVPITNPGTMPEPIATAGLHNLYGALALKNGEEGDCACGDSMMDKARDWWDSQDGTMKLVYGGLAAFGVYHFFIK